MRNYAHALQVSGIVIVLFLAGCTKHERSLNNHTNTETRVDLVPLEVAMQIAEKFNPNVYYNVSNRSNKAGFKSILTGDNEIRSHQIIRDKANIPALYVFNFREGYMMISADYQMPPVQAFVPEGVFSRPDMACGAALWLKEKVMAIEMLREGLHDDPNAKRAWKTMIANPRIRYAPPKGNTQVNIIPPPDNPCALDPNWTGVTVYTVGPLVTTRWGQGCTFNNLLNTSVTCGPGYCGMPPTGCVATAMAQVIAYWQFPALYNYSLMPVASGEVNVQSLMRDASSSVGTVYSCTGSSAYLHLADDAFLNTFGYTNATWKHWGYDRSPGGDFLIPVGNIQNGMPVIFQGFDQSEGHGWVCDGTQETLYMWCDGSTQIGNGYLDFHMNWGWGGTSNGWFAYHNWTIPGSWAFHSSNGIVFDIHP